MGVVEGTICEIIIDKTVVGEICKVKGVVFYPAVGNLTILDLFLTNGILGDFDRGDTIIGYRIKM